MSYGKERPKKRYCLISINRRKYVYRHRRTVQLEIDNLLDDLSIEDSILILKDLGIDTKELENE